MKWAYGITTVPERADTLLPRTLHSLANAGFDQPRLFVDGCDDPTQFWAWDVSVTCRGDRMGNFGNWYLGMAELFRRNPGVDRFAMFEDDIVVCKGLREYLERSPMPANGYCNLYLGGERNQILAGMEPRQGWFASDQRAYGALALVFDRSTVSQILGSESFVNHDWQLNTGAMRVDGAIVQALRNDRNRTKLEFCHKPGLVQHTGSEQSMLGHDRPAVSEMFAGEDFDARTFLK